MRKRLLHIALLCLFILSGCLQDKNREEREKWRVTMDHTDKRAYGAYLAFESLRYFYPDTKVQVLPTGFRYTNMDDNMRYTNNGHKLLILQGFNFFLSDDEWSALKQFIENGNEVIIFSSIIDSKIEQELSFEKKDGGGDGYSNYIYGEDHDNSAILFLSSDPDRKYGYTGHTIKSYFDPARDTSTVVLNKSTLDSMVAARTDSTTTDASSSGSDTTITDDETTSTGTSLWYAPDTLGMVISKPDFLRFGYGEGHLTLHAAPLVLSNYFLLQKGNEQYLSGLWHTLPDNITHIYWSDYLSRTSESSSSDILMRYPSTRYAILLALLVLLVYVLFEGKRKQRIIPIIPPLKNDSVSFVETVGRLYYNKGNQSNLAEKMVQQFLEWVRTHYLLNTNMLNDQFIQQLTIRSGQPEATVRGVVDMIHEVRLQDAKIDDAYLYQLYNTIQQFYKDHRI